MPSGAALGLQQPNINPVAHFNASQAQAQQEQAMALEQKRQGLQGLYMGSAGVLRGNLDGQADPQEWEELLDMMEQNGTDPKAIEGLRGKPHLANIMARGSADALRYAHDERQLDLSMQRLEMELQQAAAEAAQGPKPIEVNGQLIDPVTHEVLGDYRTQEDPAADAPSIVSIYDANGREQKGYMGPVDAEHPDGFYPVGNPKAETPRPEFTVSQATAAGYADRMTQSDAVLSDPAMTKVLIDLAEVGKATTPLVGNMLASPEYQQADQAKRDFINAILRRESGAVIAESEFANANRQYFPVIGDSEAVLRQKEANRRNAIAGVARSAGPAYVPPDTTNYLTGGEDPAVAAGEAGAGAGEVQDWTEYFD